MMEMTDHELMVAGVDLGGSRIAVSYFQGKELLDLHLAYYDQKDRPQALFYTLDQIIKNPNYSLTDYFFVEEPIVGRGVRASMQLSQMLGAFAYELGCRYMGEKLQLVPVTTWKQHTVGKAHATKEEVSSWLSTNFPVYSDRCGGNQDLVDATCIGLHGARVVEDARSVELTGSDEQPDGESAG
jgi:Holliday junction resolvasome RuvABC endonuclease subunit